MQLLLGFILSQGAMCARGENKQSTEKGSGLCIRARSVAEKMNEREERKQCSIYYMILQGRLVCFLLNGEDRD